MVGCCNAYLPSAIPLMQRFCAVKTTAQTSRWMTEGSTADEFMNKERTEAASPTDSIAPSSVTTKSSLDLDAPNTWIDTTDPFIVARYYALDDVTAEEIKSKLDLNGITSLELLLQAFLDLNIRWKNKIGAQMFKNMTAAIRRSQTRPTELLGGNWILTERALPRNCSVFTHPRQCRSSKADISMRLVFQILHW
jgi:hypothetical protein